MSDRQGRGHQGSCYRDGQSFRTGAVIKNNCNNCTCEPVIGRSEWKCTEEACLIRPELIQEINDGPYTWEASNYSDLWGLTLDEGTRYRLGTFKLADNVVKMTPIRVFEEPLPDSFDARQRWPNMLSPITDQGNCGSSWAHSTIALASDRLNIQSNGALNDVLSVQHLLSCNVNGQMGCNGGHLDRAWWFLRKNGVVSEKCYPFTTTRYDNAGQCLIPELNVDCPSKIEFKRGKRFKATPPYRIRPSEREIMKEIIDNGPVQASFLVHEDFFMYKRGVYKHTDLTTKRRDSDKFIKSGFHSVRIVGWGSDKTSQGDVIKYWICANSWGPKWGEGGYFRIQRGGGENLIENFVIGVLGSVSGDDKLRALLEANRRIRQKNIRKENRRRRQLRHLKSPTRNKVEKQDKERNRRHNINKIESYNDDDFTTGKRVRIYKPKSRKTKTRLRKKGKNWKQNLKNKKN